MKFTAQGDEPCIKTDVSLHEKFFIREAGLDSESSPGEFGSVEDWGPGKEGRSEKWQVWKRVGHEKKLGSVKKES